MTRADIAAAASRYVDRKLASRSQRAVDQAWQSRAWQLYHLVPEVRFAATYMANGMGCGSFPGKVVDQASSWWSCWSG